MLSELPKIYVKFLIFIILIISFAQLLNPFVVYMKLSSINEKVTDEVEWQGEISNDVTSYLSSLSTAYGVNPTVSWSGSFMPSSRGTNLIQLREPFSLELTQDVEIKFLDPSASNPLTITIPIKVKSSGKSEVFWRSGEM